MFRVNVITMAFAATVMVLSALGTASASANWFVGGTELKTSAALSTGVVVDEPATLLVPALSLSVVCSGGDIDELGIVVEPVDRELIESRRYLSCNTTKPATGCALTEKNQSITFGPARGRAFLATSPEDRILLSAATKGTLAEINFSEANTCAFAGPEPVKGSVTLGLPTGQTESVAQAVTGLGSVENNSLEIGAGNKAFIDGGRALSTLASGSKWSFR